MLIKTMEELKKEYKEWHETFEKLDCEKIRRYREDMSELEEEMEDERASKVEEKIEKLQEVYNKWKDEYNLADIAIEWSKEIYGYVKWEDEKYFYRDWLTDEETNDRVHESIDATDEKEVELFIENARKALESIGYRRHLDIYETHEYIDYIEYINRDLRHGIENGCMSILAMDILENRELWIPYREGFSDCLKKVSKEIDSTFLFFDPIEYDLDYIQHEEEE